MAGANPRSDLSVVVEAAKAGGAAALALRSETVERWEKQDGSPVSAADFASDTAISEVVAKHRPDDRLLTEERGGTLGYSGRTFVVDPIDGTRTFLNGGPDWTVAVALVNGGRPVAAAIYQPCEDLLYSAASGLGAWRNGERIRRGPAARGGRVAAPGDVHTRRGGLKDQGFGRAPYVGSIALRLASVADGTFDGLISKPGPHHWDLAAGDLIVHEAGGSLTSLTGATLRYDTAVTRHRPVVAGAADIVGRLRAQAQAHFATAA